MGDESGTFEIPVLRKRKKRRRIPTVATTYWVSSSPKGLANGSDYDNAIGTIPGGLALCTAKGDILNVIADGDHTWPTTETTLPGGSLGTSFSDYGTLIRGVEDNASENPALASIVASGADGPRYFLRVIDTTGYVIIRNLKYDATGKTGDANSYYASRLRDSPAGAPYPGPIRHEGCAFLGGGTGVAAAGARLAFAIDSTGPVAGTEVYQIEDCYFQNWDLAWTIGAALVKSMTGCLFINDVAAPGMGVFSQTLGAGTGGTVEFNNNTYYETVGNNALGSPILYQVVGALNAGTANVKDNLVFLDSTSAAPNALFFGDGGPGTGSFSGTIDYNVLLGGPNLAVGDLSAKGWYHDLWDTVAHANDQYAYQQAEATIFANPTSTYAWDPLGNGATITILKDLRPITYTTASSTGGVVGALPAGETDYTVTVTSDRVNPAVEESVQFVVTIENSGTGATSVEVTAAIPSGLTYVSHTPSAGTYSQVTGLWDIPSLPDATSETLTINVTVDAGEEGNDITFTATQTDGNPAGDPVPGDNTDSVTLSVIAEDPGDFDDPSNIPLLDQYPLRADVWQLFLNTAFITSRNRVRRHHAPYNKEGRYVREISVRIIELAASETLELVLGGIQRGSFVIVEATEQVEVSIGNTTDNWTAPATFVLLGGGDFEKITLRNPSSADATTVLIGVTD